VARPCHLFPFFVLVFFFNFNFNFNFFKKISILIYFIKMDMSMPRVANKMATRGADVAFDEIC